MVKIIVHFILTNTVTLLYFFHESAAVVQECSDVCDFNEWGKDARCQGRNLESVPQECLHAKTLHMQDNHLAKLAQGAFRNFTCLKYLYLERNNMTVEEGAFEGCSKLEKVHMNQNHLPILTEGILDGMPSVLYMFLDNASVHEIQPVAFGNLPQLRLLSLEDNLLNTPPCDAFGPDSSLQTLYLTGNNISYLPDDCFSGFNHLAKLYLKKNPLANPNPLAFRGLESLTLLDLQFTNLTKVPTGIFQHAINIKKLYLSYNNISHLSNRDFMSLYRLTHLYLQHNNLIVIQERSFEFLSILHTLDLSFNRISSLRQNTLSHLNSIRNVKLQNNFLNSTRNISFSALSSDTKVNLAHNPLHCDCHLEPFFTWLVASSINALDDSHIPSHHARCSSPPELAERLVLTLQQSDICPVENQTMSAQHTLFNPDLEMEERTQDISAKGSTFSPVIVVVIIVVIVIIIVAVVVFNLFRKTRRNDEKKQQTVHHPETSIQITSNPLHPENLAGHLQITSPSSFPSSRFVDEGGDPYYLSIDGDSSSRSPIHPPMHHPMPPRFSSQSNLTSSSHSPDISEQTQCFQDDVVYSSVLHDGNLQPTTGMTVNGIVYTSVQPDDPDPTDPEAGMRPLSMMSEIPIEEWVRNNFRLDADADLSRLTGKSEQRPPGNTGSPYVTMITQKGNSQH